MCRQLEFDFGLQPERTKPVMSDIPYFEQPKNDNQRLLNYQYEYRHGDARAADQMYTLGKIVALKFINAIGQKNRSVRHLSSEDKDDKAHNAIAYMIVQYVKRKDFIIKDSFTAYLYKRVSHELFYRRKVDKIVSFVDIETFYRGAE